VEIVSSLPMPGHQMATCGKLRRAEEERERMRVGVEVRASNATVPEVPRYPTAGGWVLGR